jgi:hypothetical protein
VGEEVLRGHRVGVRLGSRIEQRVLRNGFDVIPGALLVDQADHRGACLIDRQAGRG